MLLSLIQLGQDFSKGLPSFNGAARNRLLVVQELMPDFMNAVVTKAILPDFIDLKL